MSRLLGRGLDRMNFKLDIKSFPLTIQHSAVHLCVLSPRPGGAVCPPVHSPGRRQQQPPASQARAGRFKMAIPSRLQNGLIFIFYKFSDLFFNLSMIAM